MNQFILLVVRRLERRRNSRPARVSNDAVLGEACVAESSRRDFCATLAPPAAPPSLQESIHRRQRHYFADRLHIGSIGLAAHVRLHIRWQNQTGFMTGGNKLASPWRMICIPPCRSDAVKAQKRSRTTRFGAACVVPARSRRRLSYTLGTRSFANPNPAMVTSCCIG